jgi:hypothetical protein
LVCGRTSFLPLNINILELFKKYFIQQDSIYLSVPRCPGLVASVALEAVPKCDKKSRKLLLFIYIKSNGKYVFSKFSAIPTFQVNLSPNFKGSKRNWVYRKLHWTFAYNNPLFIPWAIQKLARKKYFWKAFPHQATFSHHSQFMPPSSGLMPQNGKTCNYLAIAIASSYFENRSKAGSLKKTSKPQRLLPYLGTMNKIKQNAKGNLVCHAKIMSPSTRGF